MVAFSILSATLVTPQAPTARLTIKVTDQMGAYVPYARIVIDPSSSKDQSSLKTDSKGNAIVDLSLGNHVISITLIGFTEWTGKVNVGDSASQSIEATLMVQPLNDWIYVQEDTRIQPDSFDLAPSIPLRTLRVLAPLPARKIPWWHGR